MKNLKSQPARRGAALIMTIVLLTCLAVVAGVVLPQILRDRREARMELLRIQSRQLLDDVFRNTEAKRHAEPEFAGSTLTLGPDRQPFPGTFEVTTRVENESLTAEVEYQNEQGTTIYRLKR